MLKRISILLVLTLAQAGCSIGEGGGAYEPVPLTDQSRSELEGLKRDFLKIEDLKVGNGSIAAWGRKIEADIEVRYADSSDIYRGPIWMYIGLEGDVFIHNASSRAGGLSFVQSGIRLGINGMAVGGKRRITIEPKLSGGLLMKETRDQQSIVIRKEKIVVEATLTDSCMPILLRAIKLPTSRYMFEREVWCSSSNEPQRSPSDPIGKLY